MLGEYERDIPHAKGIWIDKLYQEFDPKDTPSLKKVRFDLLIHIKSTLPKLYLFMQQISKLIGNIVRFILLFNLFLLISI